jgi:uncharacterized protein (UPF0332 family)
MMLDQSALLEKAHASLMAAQLLNDQGFHDFATSRAYYAMFNVAEALLLGEGLTFSKHSAVIAAFGKSFVKTGRLPERLHRYMIEGQESRNVGDYDVEPGLTEQEAATLISRAGEFIDLAERLLASPADDST